MNGNGGRMLVALFLCGLAAAGSGIGMPANLGSYTPRHVLCPSDLFVRSASSGLSLDEKAWLALRRPNTIQPMVDFLTRAHIADFDAASYIAKVSSDKASLTDLPNIAIALSGGGYRAFLNGAGFLAAADDRVNGTTSSGIGGLLQSTTYLAGLSGGSWLVSSLYANEFRPVPQLQFSGDVWKFQNSILEGPVDPDGVLRGIIDTKRYWTNIADQVQGKADAGFNTSITDYWGRALSWQLINATDGGPGYAFSDIASSNSGFRQGAIPFPIVVADGRAPGESLLTGNSTVFEFNPFEFGSSDLSVSGFVPTAWIGSDFDNGTVPGDGIRNCVNGLDQIGFVFGTSSSMFNMILVHSLSRSTLPKLAVDAIQAALARLDDDNYDISRWVVNPFLGWNSANNPWASARQLSLVDGGEDMQNIPLSPLIQPSRAVDVIFAVDSSADTNNNWPNAKALRATYDRAALPIANGTLFPPIPDVNTFINLGLNNKPVFFGCDRANFSLDEGQHIPALLVYLPLSPYTSFANISTTENSIPVVERNNMILNGLHAASQGNSTLDPHWPACVACAVLARSLDRTNTQRPQQCTDCFDKYCWNGTIATTPPAPYDPPLKNLHQSTVRSGADMGGDRLRPKILLSMGFAASCLALF